MSPPTIKWWEKQASSSPAAFSSHEGEKQASSSPAAFISHASADAAHAAEIVRVLEAANLRCWIAPRDIPVGEEWAGAIVEGVRRSRLLVVVLSVRSCASPEVYREVECASRAHKPMLTIRIDRNAVPTGTLEYFLSSIQWIDATARPLRPQLGRLPGTVGALLDLPVAPPPAASARRETCTDEVGPDLDTLLRG